MAVWVDAQGALYEVDDSQPGSADALAGQGLRPASDEDVARHNAAVDSPDGIGETLTAVGQGAGRAVSRGLDVLGVGAGLTTPDQPGPFSAESRFRAERNPIAATVGGALVATPAAVALGAAIGPLAGAAVGGGGLAATAAGTLATVAAESGVEAAAQEYEDAWLEERPAEMANVAGNLLAYGGADLLLRGLFAGGAAAARRLRRAPAGGALPDVDIAAAVDDAPLGGGGEPNMLQRAVARARKALGRNASSAADLRPHGSVGAASAESLENVWERAAREVVADDGVAVQLAADADDYLSAAAANSSGSLDRVARSLTEEFGNQLKKNDFRIHSARWNDANIAEQSRLTQSILAGARAASDELDSIGIPAARLVADDVRRYVDRLASEPDNVGRMLGLDAMKRRLDQSVKRINRSLSLDPEVANRLSGKDGIITRLANTTREGLESTAAWGDAARLQKSINAGWHRFLDSWGIIEKQLYDITGEEFATVGAGRVKREANIKRVLGSLSEDPRFAKQFREKLANSIDGLRDMATARQDYGVVNVRDIDDVIGALNEVEDDLFAAETLGLAKRRVALKHKDPTELQAILTRSAKGRLGVLGDVAAGLLREDTRLRAGSAAHDAFRRRLQRWAKSPALELDRLPISASYPDWMREAFRRYGGNVAMVSPLGLGLTGDPMAPPAPGDDPAYPAQLREVQRGARELEKRRARRAVQGNVSPGEPLSMTDEAAQGAREWLSKVADPQALIATVTAALGPLVDSHPGMVPAMVAKTIATVDYLRGVMPASQSLGIGQGVLSWSLDEGVRFAAAARGALDPERAIEDIMAGTAHAETGKALTALWPERVAAAQASVLGALELSTGVPEARLRVLDELFGGQGTLLRVASWETALAVEDAAAAYAERARQGWEVPEDGGAAFNTAMQAGQAESRMG